MERMMMKPLRLAAFLCMLSSATCPLQAQMPGGNGIPRVPLQLGGTGGTTGTYMMPGNLAAARINCNQTGDTPVAIAVPYGGAYKPVNFEVIGESGSFTTAKLGVYTAPSQGGIALQAQTALSSITAAGLNTAGNLLQLSLSGTAITAPTLYLNIGTAQGGSCIINVYVGIIPLPNG